MADDRGTGDGTGTKYQPRQEARVLKFGELTEQQKHAAFEVHALLRGYLGRKYEPSKPAKGLRRLLPHIDESRWNQNLLLDGDRGSGKTSLLVTLLQLWSDLLSCDRDEKLADDLKAKVDAWKITQNDWPVVPLSIVDLQPLPEHTPVLLHLAEPLVRVLETIEEQESPEEPAPAWLGAEHQGLKSRKAWDELVRTIVAGWDDASSERWRRLDPENAEFEINRAVRGHQAVVSSFHTFVDRLIEDFKSCRHIGGRTPLFVLSIDDADMNPDRAEELLEALRMLHHPRLVFLLTGDSELFYRITEEEVARTLRSPRSRTQKDDSSPVRDSMASELARRVYDKILPPSHRCALPLLGEDQRAAHLEKIAKLDVKSYRHPTHLIPIAQILEEPVVGAGLPGHLRMLKDLDLLVERNSGSSSASLSSVVARVWAEAIEDAPTILYLRSHLESRVRVPRGDRPLLVSALDPRPSLKESGEWLPHALVDRDEGPPATRMHGAHALTLESRTSLELDAYFEKDRAEVPRRLIGALAMADLIAFENGVQRGDDAPTTSMGFRPRFVQVLYDLPRSTTSLVIGWPVPLGFTMLDASCLNFRWRRFARTVDRTNEHGIDELARWYLAIVAQLVTMYDTKFQPLPIEPSEESPVPEWDEVALRVQHVAQRNGALSSREIFMRDWAIGRAVLLAAPESGLSAESARALLVALEKQLSEPLGVRVREVARVQRAERLRVALKGANVTAPNDAQVDEFRKQIDDQERDHPWPAFLARKLTATRTAPRAVASTPTEPTSAAPAATLESTPVALEALVTAVDDSIAVRDRFLAAMGNLGMLEVLAYEKEAVHKLPETDTPLLREFTSALDEMRGVSGQRPYAFRHLLETAAERAGFESLKNYFTASAARLGFDPLPGFEEKSLSPPRIFGPRNRKGLEFRVGSPYVVTAPDGRPLTPLLDFLYRCAWDTRENDQITATGKSPFTDGCSDFISARVDQKTQILWPSPPWRTFVHARSFAAAWTTLLDRASAPRAIPVPASDLEAALAFQYLVHASAFRNPQARQPSFAFNLEFHAPSLFTNIVLSASAPEPNLDRDVVQATVISWLKSLALLLTPESRLPQTLIPPVREALDLPFVSSRGGPAKGSFWLSRVDIESLRELRSSRLPSGFNAPAPLWDALLKSLESIAPPTP